MLGCSVEGACAQRTLTIARFALDEAEMSYRRVARYLPPRPPVSPSRHGR